MKIIHLIRILMKLNLFKTIYFNFHYFPFRTAIRLPFFIYRHSKFYCLSGKIIIDAPVKTGMFKFGQRKLTIIDSIYDRTIWKLSGTLIIKGSVGIGRGTKINVDENATLIFGDNFDVTGNTTFVCNKEIQFGSNCLLSWDILIMDSDQHAVIDVNNNVLNPPKAISIGNHVWIGCRSTILKGVCIADDNIVAANSTVTKSFTNSNSIIGGHGKNVEVIKNNINWRH